MALIQGYGLHSLPPVYAPQVGAANGYGLPSNADSINDGYDIGYADGHADGYADGYADGIAAGGGDTTQPTVTILSPLPGSAIGPHSHLRFRITDNSGLRRSLPMIRYPNNRYETIHDGETFTPDFTGTREPYSGPGVTGFEYDVVRNGGWPMIKDPVDDTVRITLVPFAFDISGNETQ